MRKFTLFVLTLVLALGSLPQAAVQAQLADGSFESGQDVGGYVSGVTTATGSPILIKYIGNSPAGGVVTVDAGTGDIELETGLVGAATADLTTECPVVTALGGLIDVSDAACNTLGEVVDAINASPNWRAVIQDGLRSDSSNTLLNTLAETQANVPAGIPLKIDGVAVDYNTIALIPLRDDIRWFLQEKAPTDAGVATNPGSGINSNPFNDSQAFFRYAFANVTGTGALASGFNVYSVAGNYSRPKLAVAATAASIVGVSTETVTTLYTAAPGANGVDTSFSLFATYGLGGRRGEKLVVRVQDAALTNSALGANGRFRKRN